MRWFRHADPRYPFLWETAAQPAARWHGVGQGPAQYLADTPAGAWAEHIRHEAITDPEDLADVTRALWAVEVPDDEMDSAVLPLLPMTTLTGGTDSYQECRQEASLLRSNGATALLAPSAALVTGAAGPERTDRGLRRQPPVDGKVLVVFGARPQLGGWRVVAGGRLGQDLLVLTRPL